MHIYLLVPWWKVVIYDDRDLLNINTAGQHVSGDQNSRRARLKVLEVCFTIRLWFFAMLFVEGHESIWKFKYRKSGVLTVAKAGSCRSSSCVRSLSTFSRVLQKTTVGCVKVGVVYRSHKVSSFQSSLSMRRKKLLNSFNRELFSLDKNFDGVAAHDGPGHGTEGVCRDRGWKQDDLHALLGKMLKHY